MLKTTFLAFILLFALLPLRAQTGFSTTFLLPHAASNVINSMAIDADTIVAFGSLQDTAYNYWGMFIAKFDTFGQYITHKTVFDSTKHQICDLISRVIVTQDGGYLGVGTLGLGQKAVVVKFDHNLNLEWQQAYTLNAGHFFVPRNVIELADGYLVCGHANDNISLNIFAMKIDPVGTKIWYKTLAKTDYRESCHRLFAIDSNQFIISSTREALVGLGEPGYFARSLLVKFDSTGQVLFTWQSALNEDEAGLEAVSADGATALFSYRHYEDGPLDYIFQVGLRKIDLSTGEVLWKKPLSPVEILFTSAWADMTLAPDSNAIHVAGIHQVGFISAGWTARISLDGDYLWERYDTANPAMLPYPPGSQNTLYSIAYLSSGSLIASGQVVRKTDYPYNEAWLLKLSPDGCLAPDDCAPVATAEPAPGARIAPWQLYPNPAREIIWLVPGESQFGQSLRVEWYNTAGMLAKTSSEPFIPGVVQELSVRDLQPGMYFYRMVLDQRAVGSGKVLVE